MKKNKAAQSLARKSVEKRFAGMSVEEIKQKMSLLRKGKKKGWKLSPTAN